jgi:hypothetical protein
MHRGYSCRTWRMPSDYGEQFGDVPLAGHHGQAIRSQAACLASIGQVRIKPEERDETGPLVRPPTTFSIDACARRLGGCWGATEWDDPPNPGTHWDGPETNVQLSGMVRDRAGSCGMKLASLPN